MNDLVVVGGGPVGLVAALYARRMGLSVEVVEQRAHPIDKACGEGIMPAGLDLLAALGVDPPGHDINGVRYVDSRGSATAYFKHGTGRGVRRPVLQYSLRGAVENCGIGVVPGKVKAVEQDETGVTARLTGGSEVRGRFLIGADGLHSTVRRTANDDPRGADPGKARAGRRGERRRGLRRHYPVAPWCSLVEVHWADGAEAYVTPVSDSEVGVAILSTTAGGFDDHLQEFPELIERFTGAEPSSNDRGAGPLRQQSSWRVRGRVLIVGDAAGYVDALTGEGLTVGWRQAEAAVAAVAGERPDLYDKQWRSITRRSTLLTSGLVSSTRLRPVRRRIVPAARAMPWVFGSLVDLAARG